MSKRFERFIHKNQNRIKAFSERIVDYKIEGESIGFINARKRVISWLKNFDVIGFKNFELPLQLLENIEFVSSKRIYENLFEKAKNLIKDPKTHVAPLGELSESSFRISANHNQNKNFHISLSELLSNISDTEKHSIVLFDDFLNSGGQVVTIFKRFLGIEILPGDINDEWDSRTELTDSQKSKLRKADIHLFYYKAFDEGIALLELNNNNNLKLNIEIHRYSTINKTGGAFGDENDQIKIENGLSGTLENSGAFMGKEYRELTEFYNSLKVIGGLLLRKNKPNWNESEFSKRALGYGNQAHLIISEFNIPTITLTALWHGGEIVLSGKKIFWNSLLKRREKILIAKNKSMDSNFISPHVKNSNMQLKSFHELILVKYLKKGLHFNLDSYEIDSKRYSKLFSPLIKFNGLLTFSNEEAETNIFIKLIEQILISESNNPLLVNGFAGCGKSAFLSILYLTMKQYFTDKKIDKIPVLIDLHYYNKYLYQSTLKSFQEQGKDLLNEDLKLLMNEINENSNKEFIIIIDGADEYINPKVDLDYYIFTQLNNLLIKKKIVGLRRHKEENSKSFKKSKAIRIIEDPEIEIELNKLSIDDEKFDSFILSYSEIESKHSSKKAEHMNSLLHEKIQKFKIEDIDLFYLNMLSNEFKSTYSYQGKNSLSEFYQKYFEVNNIDLGVASELAFQIFNKPESIQDKDKNSLEWWNIQKHDSIRDFLVAYHVINKLTDYNPKSQNTFNYVYPYDLNSFCKEILNSSQTNQNKVFESIKNILKTQNTSAKTHLCYLLGRFSSQSLKDNSKILLRRFKDEVEKSLLQRISFDSLDRLSPKDKLELRHLRTIYISLSYLGDTKAAEEYISQLINNKYFDNLNRGFHLEYYEDIVFDPSSPENLRLEDNLNGFEKTYFRLVRKLKNAILCDQEYSMFEIELYTICSLAQQRHIVGTLDSNKKCEIQEIISNTLSKHRNICRELSRYLRFINYIFSIEYKLKKGSFIKNLYKVKSLQRSGWIVRNIKSPETVASHMYGAYLLGLLHLPSQSLSSKEYSKDKILKMVLIHDLAEAYIGDLLPHEKTSESTRIEYEQFEYHSLIGTYEGIANLNELLNLFEDFTHGNDINSTIARELDKLENLLQLHIYKNDEDQPSIEDFDSFENALVNPIHTKEGKRIKDIILNLFKD